MGPLVIILVLLVLAWIIRAGLGRGSGPVFRGLRHSRAVCGSCGYAADVRAAERCPECGSRYHDGGIVTRALAVRMGPPLWVIAIVILPLGLVIAGLLGPLVSRVISQIEYGIADARALKYDYRTRPNYGPNWQRNDRPTYDFTIAMDVIAGAGQGPPVSGLIELGIGGGGLDTYRATYDIGDGEWILLDADDRELERGTALPDAAEALYRRSGADGLWEGSAAEMANARQLAELTLTTTSVTSAYAAPPVTEEYGLGSLSGGGGGGSVGTGPMARLVVRVILPLASLCLPLVAVLVIHRVRRRVTAEGARAPAMS
jgi:hypothetical protein